MISANFTRFKFIDRAKQTSIVFVPGWATDYRIFGCLDLLSGAGLRWADDFNYLVPVCFWPFDFEDKLTEALKTNNISKVTIFGLSLGGFLASRFASKYASLVDELILVSMRKKYAQQGLETIEGRLKKNKRAYLYKFYSQCFYDHKQMSWFKNNLLKPYCQELDLNYLLRTLDFLKSAQVDILALSSVKKIKIIHGEDDKVASINEAREISDGLRTAELISLPCTGHFPFLKDNFSQYVR